MTTLRERASGRSGERGPRLISLLTTVALILAAAATVRLAVVVAASPPERWLAQDPRLVDPLVRPDPSRLKWVERLGPVLRDPALEREPLARCNPKTTPPVEGKLNCLEAVSEALRVAPYSAELWLFRATELSKGMLFDEELWTALRRSYLTGPREGWVASGRVVLGLRLWPLLPPDLQQHVRNDLVLVLENNLAGPLASAYVNDRTLRRTARPALEGVPRELADWFIGATRDALTPNLAPG